MLKWKTEIEGKLGHKLKICHIHYIFQLTLGCGAGGMNTVLKGKMTFQSLEASYNFSDYTDFMWLIRHGGTSVFTNDGLIGTRGISFCKS